MKKLKNKTLLGIMIGLVIGSIGVVIAEYKLKASDVEFKNGKSVQDAIEDLYNKAKTHCPDGEICSIGTATGATIEGVNERGEQLDASGNVVKDSDNNPIVVTHKGIVYLDPTDLTRTCDKAAYEANLNAYYASNGNLKVVKADGTEVPTSTGLKTGCMKWYVYNKDGNKYDLILDHNTTPRVAWAKKEDFEAAGGTWITTSGSQNYSTKGPITIAKELYMLTESTANNGSGWKIVPRMITADEVAHITGADVALKWSSAKAYGTDDNDTKSSWFYLDGGRHTNPSPTVYDKDSNGWQKQYATTLALSNYAWLYDYTGECKEYGCEVADDNEYGGNVYGYWTSTKSNQGNGSSSVWRVNYVGNLDSLTADSEGRGLRPVISISKFS